MVANAECLRQIADECVSMAERSADVETGAELLKVALRLLLLSNPDLARPAKGPLNALCLN
jgi:hypothetical protein